MFRLVTWLTKRAIEGHQGVENRLVVVVNIVHRIFEIPERSCAKPLDLHPQSVLSSNDEVRDIGRDSKNYISDTTRA
jgi:hypothetical protein